ncbi:deoxyhypusine hydroxylase-like protein [Naegleria gruberi]|uniref:Deoxyhypusine hydroxylase n=1 Tax=Naegleria gruberi TaxID=5762 RepID=D2VMF5_NAEGR|nr:deoxyhypusine hydroxylase-like protein [Naegleria gruberi]EFC42053.1 deoxyhypusine hydroxylase-like protein [Naegleria gruberi]|eukprot:XP_002674797.1 deoxyhypusine hydroxylase-like protein [Naegleria gruberi strain NEG-M]
MSQQEEISTDKHNFNDPADEFAAFTDDELKQLLSNDDIPVSRRSRMLYYLKQWTESEDKIKRAIDVLSSGFVSKSALLRHEIGYVMGQIHSEHAIPILVKILSDLSEDCMVRHEAGEALGAIGSPLALPALEEHSKDSLREVRETCELAILNIEYQQEQLKKKQSDEETIYSPFSSVDPAPACENDKKLQFDDIKNTFLDMSKPLFERYKAMFTLRNIAGQYLELDKHDYALCYKRKGQAIEVLCQGLTNPEEGALFKHEVAFVLGQIQERAAAEALESTLRDKNQHAMVRHEAAEALGSISEPESLKLLEEFQADEVEAVKDSCVVAIDMHNYWSAFLNLHKSSEEDQE